MTDDERSAVHHLHEVITEMDATLRSVAGAAARGLQAPTASDCPAQVEWARRALTEIAEMVR